METTTTEPAFVESRTVDRLVRSALFAALIGALAFVSFPYPLSPAPVTLQVLGIFLAGIFLGPLWGPVSVGVYLLVGALGLPVFAGGTAGVGILVGESGGYLLSFPVAALAIGWIVHGGRTVQPPGSRGPLRLLGGMLVGIAIIHAGGVIGLMIVLSLTLWEAIVFGAIVFLPAEGLKIAAAFGIIRSDRLAATTNDE